MLDRAPLGVLVGLVVVLLVFIRYFVSSALFAVTKDEVIVAEYTLGHVGEVITRAPRPVSVERYWDSRYKVVQVGDVRAYVTKRPFGAVLDNVS